MGRNLVKLVKIKELEGAYVAGKSVQGSRMGRGIVRALGPLGGGEKETGASWWVGLLLECYSLDYNILGGDKKGNLGSVLGEGDVQGGS